MASWIRPAEYYCVTVPGELGTMQALLADLAGRGVKLLGFAAIPIGPNLKQLTIFPEDPALFVAEARAAKFPLEGPHHAILVSGDSELDALAGVHEQLFMAGIEIYATSGVSDAHDAFSYVIYVREDQFDGACGALGCDTPELRAANEWLDLHPVARVGRHASGPGH
jgi:hypothetical protein